MPTCRFRAVNKPSASPPKPTAANQHLPDVPRKKCEIDHVQASARLSVVVPMSDRQSARQPQRVSDFSPAVVKAKRASEKPRKKKKRLASSTSKPRRQQAAREAKLVPSIEYSPRKSIGSPTPECGTDGADDSDFVPSKADPAEMSMNSASNPPSRRSPRKHASKFPRTGLPPQTSSAQTIIRGESSLAMAPATTARPPPLLTWSSPIRQKIYEEDGFVELHQLEFEYKQSEKEMRQQLAKQKEAMMAEKRREKGEFAEQRSIETYESTRRRDKRKAEEQSDQTEPYQRQKLQKSQKAGPEDRSLTYYGKNIGEGKTTDEQAQKCKAFPVKAKDRSDITDVHTKPGNEARSEGSKKKKMRRSCGVGAKARLLQLPDARSNQSRGQAPKNSGQQKRILDEKRREDYRRREVSVDVTCGCSALPEYFTRNGGCVPSLATWDGGSLEFFVHVEQIKNCRGSFHPTHVVDACRKILEETGYPECWKNNSIQSSLAFAPGSSSTSGRNDSKLRRAQSSIPPPVFYGNRNRCRPDPHTESSSRSVPQPPQTSNTESTSSNALPVRNRGQFARTHDAPLIGPPLSSAVPKDPCTYLTPPNSRPLGQRRKVGMPSPHEGDNSTSGKENVGAAPISKTLPEASGILRPPRHSFDIQRRRHQSVPVNGVHRNTTVDERNYLLPSERHGNALNGISNNAILQRVDRLERVIFARLPATAPTQVAAAETISALASASSPAATARDTNRVEQPPTRIKRKRLSNAERRLKYPKLDRNVPAHQRLTDEEIIAVGRIVSPYERHAKAPQAFDWNGHFYAPYKRLLNQTVDGVPIWTTEEMYRITR